MRRNTKPGFTLLEVILVVAISTLLFMSVVVGIGSRIATGRYETASTEITDYFRDVYTAALNVENSRRGTEGEREYCTVFSATEYPEGSTDNRYLAMTNDKKFANSKSGDESGPGRTDCAIYGKAIYFSNGNEAHIFDVVGNIVTNVKQKQDDETYITDLKRLENASILEQLEYVRADIFAALPDTPGDIDSSCRLSAAGEHAVYEPNWGTLFKTANYEKDTNFVGMVMIVRAPASGNISTFFYERPKDSGEWEFLDYFDGENNSDISCGPYIESEAPNEESNSPVQLLLRQQQEKEDYGTDDEPENTGFCIGSDDFYIAISGQRKFVEFIPGGQNASAIKLIESNDKEENPCLQ